MLSARCTATLSRAEVITVIITKHTPNPLLLNKADGKRGMVGKDGELAETGMRFVKVQENNIISKME